MEYTSALHLSPIEMLFLEEDAHAAQVEEAALAASLYQDNRRGGLGAGEGYQARVVDPFGANAVAYELAKAIFADGGGNADRHPQAGQCDCGVDAIAAGAERDVLKRLALPRPGKMIHWPGQYIGHGITHAKYLTSYHKLLLSLKGRA
jgi:hypothetical protein